MEQKRGKRQEDRWTVMRDEIEDIFRSGFEKGKTAPQKELKIDRQRRQSMMESGERLNGWMEEM